MKKRISVVLILAAVLFFSSCEKEVSTSPPMEPIPVGFIKIESNPPGAKIYEDGRNTSLRTPDSLGWLEEREYRFTLKLELYRDTSFNVDVDVNEKKNVFIDYHQNQRMLGGIFCKTNLDSAKIFLNGEFTGKYTPDTIKGLIPGEYNIRYEREQCRAESLSVTITSNVYMDAPKVLKDTSVWVDYSTNTSGLPSNLLSCLAIDKQNNIWIGTRDAGVVKYDGINWVNYNMDNSELFSNYITAIEVTESGEVYIGSLDGLTQFSDGLYTVLYQRLPSKHVTAIFEDRDGILWVGTKGGLVKREGNFVEVINYPLTEGFPLGNDITGIVQDHNRHIWVSVYGKGLAKWNKQYWKSFNFDFMVDGILRDRKENNYNCLVFDGDFLFMGHSFIASYGQKGGISRYDVRFGYFYYYFPELWGRNVSDIIVRGDGEKYISTDDGLYIYKAGRPLQHFHTLNSNIPSRQIEEAEVAVDGSIWIITPNAGMVHYKRNLL